MVANEPRTHIQVQEDGVPPIPQKPASQPLPRGEQCVCVSSRTQAHRIRIRFVDFSSSGGQTEELLPE